MKEKEIIHKLKELQNNDDIEINHHKADQILCDFLLSLGYEKIVKEFAKIEKWYS